MWQGHRFGVDLVRGRARMIVTEMPKHDRAANDIEKQGPPAEWRVRVCERLIWFIGRRTVTNAELGSCWHINGI